MSEPLGGPGASGSGGRGVPIPTPASSAIGCHRHCLAVASDRDRGGGEDTFTIGCSVTSQPPGPSVRACVGASDIPELIVPRSDNGGLAFGRLLVTSGRFRPL